MTIYTASAIDNAALIRDACELYIADGATVADVTWGRGAFWQRTDTSRFKLFRSDLHPIDDSVTEADFRSLPYETASLDVVVLDPPYIHNPGQHVTDKRYNNAATTTGMYHADILRLYVEGIIEARRVLRPEGGQLWVKCKDEVESGVQRWSHLELYQAALAAGFFGRDLFLVVPRSKTSSNRWARQIHARKNHSYLWVFELPRKRDAANLRRAGVIA